MYGTVRSQAQRKKEIDKLDYITIKNVCASKILLAEWKITPYNERKYLQIIFLIKELISRI